jgi:uncharacterized membrane protein
MSGVAERWLSGQRLRIFPLSAKATNIYLGRCLLANLFHLLVEGGAYLQNCLHLNFGNSPIAGVF